MTTDELIELQRERTALVEDALLKLAPSLLALAKAVEGSIRCRDGIADEVADAHDAYRAALAQLEKP